MMRFLDRHEAQAHAVGGREVRDLGDAILLHDRDDRDPFWNRLSGLRLPEPPTRSTPAWPSSWRSSPGSIADRTSGRRRSTSARATWAGAWPPTASATWAAGS